MALVGVIRQPVEPPLKKGVVLLVIISACRTTLLLDLNKSLRSDQSYCSILSHDHKFM